MLWVYGDPVVILIAALADVMPAAFLFLEIETGGVGEENGCQEHAGETEPGNDVETCGGQNVVVEDGGREGAEFADRSGHTVSGGADGRWVHFGGHEEGDAVRTELIEEGGEEVHGLEGVNAMDVCVVIVVESGDDKEDEVEKESDLLHPFTAVKLVINHEG